MVNDVRDVSDDNTAHAGEEHDEDEAPEVDVEVLGPDEDPDVEDSDEDDADAWNRRVVQDEVQEEAEKLEDDDESRETSMMALRDAFFSLPALPDTAVSADPLTIYLQRLRALEVLDADTQQRLAVQFKEEGDLDAAKMLILSNLRLVVKIAREYRRRWTNLLELIQEGNVGLSEAIRRYDPYRKVKFTSYAQYWIRAMILNYLMNHFQPVRIGSTRAGRKLFYNLKKARRQLEKEGHENPSPALIAEKLGVKEKDVIQISQHLDAPPVSLDQNAAGYENTTVGELMADRDAASPEEAFGSSEFQAQVRQAMDDFADEIDNDRDRAIWFERMIADEDDRLTLSTLGDRFGVSKERIRQLEVRLKRRFKEFIMERLGATLELFFDSAGD